VEEERLAFELLQVRAEFGNSSEAATGWPSSPFDDKAVEMIS